MSNFIVYYTLKYLGARAFFPHTKLQKIDFYKPIIAILMSNDARFIAAGIFGSLYFLPSYFIASILFFCFLRMKKIWLKYILFFSAPLLATTMTEFAGYHNIPWGINIAMLMLPMMYFGIIYNKIENFLEELRKNHTVLFIITIICSIIIINYFKIYGGSVHNCNIKNIFVFYMLAILGFLACLGIALLIRISSITNLFVCIGKYTLPIYGFHIFVLDFYRLLLNKFLFYLGLENYLIDYPWCFYMIYVLLSIFIIVFISNKIIKKNKLLSLLFLGTN